MGGIIRLERISFQSSSLPYIEPSLSWGNRFRLRKVAALLSRCGDQYTGTMSFVLSVACRAKRCVGISASGMG